VHLASAQVDLDTHITDVVNLIEFEDLHDVVLLGHSYGGLVVTGAADRISERISEFVYLDTTPLPRRR
jgi:pimeloyl-ACP methyl ester carboxylesterase